MPFPPLNRTEFESNLLEGAYRLERYIPAYLKVLPSKVPANSKKRIRSILYILHEPRNVVSLNNLKRAADKSGQFYKRGPLVPNKVPTVGPVGISRVPGQF
jgi:hypothetical protein